MDEGYDVDWVTKAGQMIRYQVWDHRIRSASDHKRILVVVPCYNAQEWIAPCLLALKENKVGHDVLLIEDGGVPLAGLSLDENFVHFRLDRNIGLIGVLNLAARFALSEGYEFYVRQDADDFSKPDRLQKQLSLADKTGADLVVGGAEVVDDRGELLWVLSGTLPRNVTDSLLVRNPFVHSTWFLRTDTFKVAGCYDDRYVGAEDFEFLHRIARRATICSVPEPLVEYRVHAGSVLGSSNKSARMTVKVIAGNFSWVRPASYYGMGRSLLAAILPRSVKTRFRSLLRGVNR